MADFLVQAYSFATRGASMIVAGLGAGIPGRNFGIPTGPISPNIPTILEH